MIMYFMAFLELAFKEQSKLKKIILNSFFHINSVTVWLLVENITQTYVLTRDLLSQLTINIDNKF